MYLNEIEIQATQRHTNKNHKSYVRRQLQRVIPILRSIARNCPIEYRYPIQKILKQLSKIFKVNQFEATFFGYMIRETKWNFREEVIVQHSEIVNETFCNINQQTEFKSIILYLVLVIFNLKKFLNQENELFLEQAIKICPQFESVFQKWAKRHSRLTKKVNPKTLNKVYQDIYFKTGREQPNFNILVDSILQISPPYSFDFNKNKKILIEQKLEEHKISTPKQRKPLTLTSSSQNIKNEDCLNVEINPIFSSQRIHQMIEGICEQQNMIEVSVFQVFGMSKFKKGDFNFDRSVYGNSEYSGDVKCELKFEEDFCNELRLGLWEGQSQQNVRKNDKAAEVSQNMAWNSSRVNLTDQYLNWKVEGSEFNY